MSCQILDFILWTKSTVVEFLKGQIDSIFHGQFLDPYKCMYLSFGIFHIPVLLHKGSTPPLLNRGTRFIQLYSLQQVCHPKFCHSFYYVLDMEQIHLCDNQFDLNLCRNELTLKLLDHRVFCFIALRICFSML